jgi:acyl carrier protein
MTLSSERSSIAPPSPIPLQPSPSGTPDLAVEARVREFITEFFYVSDPASLTDDLSLIDSGLVDSTGMMDVIVFLESEYEFHVEDDEMVPENLESIELIARFVDRKTHEGSQPGVDEARGASA